MSLPYMKVEIAGMVFELKKQADTKF